MYSHYALAPPAGKEFETLQFACDIEQFDPSYGATFQLLHCRHGIAEAPQCASEQSPGPTTDGKPDEPGRKTVNGTIAIPAGAGLVHIEICAPQEDPPEKHVHRAQRRRKGHVPVDNPQPAANAGRRRWAQTELHPPSGKLTWGTKVLQNERAYSGIAPGRDTLRFSVEGDPRSVEIPFEIKPGRRYGLFLQPRQPLPMAATERGTGQWSSGVRLRPEHPPDRHGFPRHLVHARRQAPVGSQHRLGAVDPAGGPAVRFGLLQRRAGIIPRLRRHAMAGVLLQPAVAGSAPPRAATVCG